MSCKLGTTPKEDCESFATWKKSDSSLSAGTGELVDEDDLESLASSAWFVVFRLEPEGVLAAGAVAAVALATAAAAAELRAAMTSREGAGGRILANPVGCLVVESIYRPVSFCFFS